MKRCAWVPERDPVYVAYHDIEWGVPIREDRKLYELFLLETFQAGLSWITILKKRENFRKAFDNFDPQRIARYGDEKIQQLLLDKGIIRCKRKILAAVKNAGIFLSIAAEYGSFSDYLWGFVQGRPVVNRDDEIRTATSLSDAVSGDLQKRGMSYVGSVTIYSYLQAVGVVNDHETGCFRHPDNGGKE